MSSDDSDLRLEQFLPYRLSVLTNRISQALARRYEAEFGLTIAEWRSMAVIGRFGPVSSREIGEHAAMEKARISRAVSKLLKQGLIERRTDRRDGRLLRLTLSAKGKEVYRQIAAMALAWEADLLKALDEDQRRTLSDILDALSLKVDASAD